MAVIAIITAVLMCLWVIGIAATAKALKYFEQTEMGNNEA